MLSSAERLALWPPRSLTPSTPFWPCGCVCCYVSHANNTMDTHTRPPNGPQLGEDHLLKRTSWPLTWGCTERQAGTNLQGEAKQPSLVDKIMVIYVTARQGGNCTKFVKKKWVSVKELLFKCDQGGMLIWVQWGSVRMHFMSESQIKSIFKKTKTHLHHIIDDQSAVQR